MEGVLIILGFPLVWRRSFPKGHEGCLCTTPYVSFWKHHRPWRVPYHAMYSGPGLQLPSYQHQPNRHTMLSWVCRVSSSIWMHGMAGKVCGRALRVGSRNGTYGCNRWCGNCLFGQNEPYILWLIWGRLAAHTTSYRCRRY